ncbi:MAG TPA: putative sugar nucleotidyl transferase [Tepidisphaeraceae bacterium]|jgi:UDP-N-acetylglucosamine diphosphorylase/glucosamine-1-phosphate N-acetyltransferase|nr:putative sugar nucleotidyl transferase [Tepidisphaeraceae bacterium]
MHVVIFEGIYWTKFAPLSLSRPIFSLVTGRSTLLEKQIRHLAPSRLSLWVRPELADYCRQRILPKLSIPATVNQPLDDEPALLVAGRTLMLQDFQTPTEHCVQCDDEQWVRKAFVQMPGLSPDDAMRRSDLWESMLKLPRIASHSRIVDSIWDLIKWNEESLIEDFTSLRAKPGPKPTGPYHMLHDDEIYLGKNVSLAPGCVLDASKGPIFIGEHAMIGANSVVEGPCSIGNYCLVKPFSHIRPSTSLGTMCKVGGEISSSILLGHSNKQHEGFLGDSYLGKWVNFGAGTTTSNMKNTYGEINVQMGSETRPTGRRFLGAIVGDHVKTGILTRLMAGSYLGFGSQLSGSSIPPKFLPSFSFWTDKGLESYDLSKCRHVATRAFARHDRQWSDVDESILQYAARTAPATEKI